MLAASDTTGKAASTIQPAIDEHGRDICEEAARDVQHVRPLCVDHLERPDAWKHTMSQLREEHKRLPALEDKLIEAGLY